MINIPGKGTQPHVLCSVPYAGCCARSDECSSMMLQALYCVCCAVLCAATLCHTFITVLSLALRCCAVPLVMRAVHACTVLSALFCSSVCCDGRFINLDEL